MKKILSKGLVLSLLVGTMVILSACGAKAPATEEEGKTGGERAPVVVPEGEPEMTMTGSTVAAFGPMEGVLDLYEEGTVILTVNYANRVTELQGSWEKKDDTAIAITLEQKNYDVKKADDGSFAFEYNTFDGKGEAIIPFSTTSK